MKYRPVLTLLVFATAVFAQDRMAETLRKGVVEEESKQNLAAAIQDYGAVLAQFNDARQTAATALFRMAECYRKQGKKPEAIAAYQRVVQEFTDQSKLADQSRGVLTKTYQVAVGAQTEQRAKTDEARARYRATIEKEMDLVRKQLTDAKQMRKLGTVGEDAIDSVNVRMLQLERELAAFDAGMSSPKAR